MLGYCLSIYGILPSDFVKTDLNCLMRILALVGFSYCSIPSCLRGETPILSLFLLLMYRQNGLLLFSCRPLSIDRTM